MDRERWDGMGDSALSPSASLPPSSSCARCRMYSFGMPPSSVVPPAATSHGHHPHESTTRCGRGEGAAAAGITATAACEVDDHRHHHDTTGTSSSHSGGDSGSIISSIGGEFWPLVLGTGHGGEVEVTSTAETSCCIVTKCQEDDADDDHDGVGHGVGSGGSGRRRHLVAHHHVSPDADHDGSGGDDEEGSHVSNWQQPYELSASAAVLLRRGDAEDFNGGGSGARGSMMSGGSSSQLDCGNIYGGSTGRVGPAVGFEDAGDQPGGGVGSGVSGNGGGGVGGFSFATYFLLLDEAILHKILSTLRVEDLLSLQCTCTLLNDFIVRDADLWRQLSIRGSLAEKVNDTRLLVLIKRAVGGLRVIEIEGCRKVTGNFLLTSAMKENLQLEKISLRSCHRLSGAALVTLVGHLVQACSSSGQVSHLHSVQLEGSLGIQGRHVRLIEKLNSDADIDISPCPNCPMAGKIKLCGVYSILESSSGDVYNHAIIRGGEIGCENCLIQCPSCGEYYCRAHVYHLRCGLKACFHCCGKHFCALCER